MDFALPEEFGGGDLGGCEGSLVVRSGLFRLPRTFALSLEAQPCGANSRSVATISAGPLRLKPRHSSSGRALIMP